MERLDIRWENYRMTSAIKQKVRVREGGVVEVRSPDLTPGRWAEVIVLVEDDPGPATKRHDPEELEELLKSTQSLPSARRLTEEEIQAEVAAHRARRK